MQNQNAPTSRSDAAEQGGAALLVRRMRLPGWYDYLWSCLPIALLYTGGKFGMAGYLLGALVGIGGVLLNLRILRGQRGVVLRHLLSLLATIGAYVVFAIVITIYQAYTHAL